MGTFRKYHISPILYPASRHHRGAALLIDVVVAIAIFGMLFGAILTSLQRIAEAQIELKTRLAASFLMTSQFEKAHSIPYASVGTSTGNPSGVFAASEQIVENNTTFTRTTAVRYIDDPHDGLAGADANAKPNDYKQISVTISWSLKGNTRSIHGSQYISNATIEP